jgi:hypothetical protein
VRAHGDEASLARGCFGRDRLGDWPTAEAPAGRITAGTDSLSDGFEISLPARGIFFLGEDMKEVELQGLRTLTEQVECGIDRLLGQC